MRRRLKPRAGLVIALAILLPSCGRPVLALRPSIEPSRQIRILRVIAEDAGATVTVSGRIVRGIFDRSPLSGHLDIVAQFRDGRPGLRLHFPFVSGNGPKSAYFKTQMPITDAASLSTITVSHVQDHVLTDAPGKPS